MIRISYSILHTLRNVQSNIPGTNVTELGYVTQLYITRNVTAVLGLIVALLFRSHKALFVLLVVRIVTDISDVITIYAFDAEAIKASVPMVVGLLIIIPLFSLRYLWKRIKED